MVLRFNSKINETGNENRVTSPPSWTRGDEESFSNVKLPATRDSFWRIVPVRDGGRTEIWEALKEAAECQDLERKQEIIDRNNIRLGNRDMTECFDDTGNRYKLPDYVLSDPTDMNDDFRTNKCGISPCSIV